MTRVRLADRSDADIARQVRGARAMLGWSQDDLARRAAVAPRTIADLEAGRRLPRDGTVERIVQALSEAGMVLVGTPDGIGLFLKSSVDGGANGKA
ncbi:helix-turn-helix domain-containing protein [Methylobacterium sp. C25]|uniref:helix-turn-helix domain-containing protein n=1 Tax=Methylobacterium sp. C25 TaxID=2721622 RepID=UPI001F43996E|nr:helix-turn-helix transcriptional regulator [Methylobacterium sp. C25]